MSKRKRLEEAILRVSGGFKVNEDILSSIEKEVYILIADFYESFNDVEQRDMLLELVMSWWKEDD